MSPDYRHRAPLPFWDRSDPALGWDAAVLFRLNQRVVVALVLVGVGLGELGDGAVEGVVGAEVGGDGDAIAGAGMGAGERGGAHVGVDRHRGRRQRLDQRRTLPVPELADV